jgi:enoyl-CoA hydratase
MYGPEDAIAAGFLDRVVPASELGAVARSIAAELARLDADVHAASKRRARAHALTAIRAAIDADDAAFRAAVTRSTTAPATT